MPAILLAIIAVLLLAFSPQSKADEAGVNARLRDIYPELRAKAMVYPGLYAMINQTGEFNGMVVDESLTYIANNGKANWQTISGDRVAPPDVDTRFRLEALKKFPAVEAIQFLQGKQPIAFYMVSAVDCSACLLAATQMKSLPFSYGSLPFSYGILPTYLNRSRRTLAANIWCSQDPQTAWENLMVKRTLPKPVADCGYPDLDIKVTDAVFGHMMTPTLIFADGEAYANWPDTPAQMFELRAKIQDKLAKGIHF